MLLDLSPQGVKKEGVPCSKIVSTPFTILTRKPFWWLPTFGWMTNSRPCKLRTSSSPPKQKHQKATLAELLTLAIFLLLQGQDLAKGYLAAKTTLKAYFPSLPHLSRFYRVLQKAQGLLAHLAMRLSGGQGLLQVVYLKPIPLAHGHRIHGLSLPEAAMGVGPLGAFAGYVHKLFP